jgi:filamentous hemagglutinin
MGLPLTDGQAEQAYGTILAAGGTAALLRPNIGLNLPKVNKIATNQLGKFLGEYSAVNPGPLSADLALTFSGSKYSVVELSKDTVLYRAGKSGQPLGQFFDINPPNSVLQARIDKAILPVWPNGAASPIDTVFTIKIPAETKIYTGEVGYQSGFYLGGTRQIVVLKPWAIDGITVIDSRSLK